MPELPEAEVTAMQLRARLIGRRLADIWVGRADIVREGGERVEPHLLGDHCHVEAAPAVVLRSDDHEGRTPDLRKPLLDVEPASFALERNALTAQPSQEDCPRPGCENG